MVDVLAAPQQAKADSSLRTLTAISVAHWVSHFHLFVLPMLFPYLKAQLGTGYIELGFALTVFGLVSGLTQAPIGYLADHIGARKVLLIGLTLGGLSLIGLGLHLSYTSLVVCAALLGRSGLSAKNFVALMPGAEFGPAKRWPSESYAELALAMMARGLKVALLGSRNDAEVTAEIAALAPGAVDLAGKTRLEDAIDLIAAAKLAVSNDSGLMHVAAAVGTPIVAVYGSTSPENTPPLSEHAELVWLGLSCSPCHQKTCPLGHLNCLKTLDAARVAAAADRLLDMPAAA